MGPSFSKNSLHQLAEIGKSNEDGESILTKLKSRYGLKWGRIKSYLVSFGHFLKFLRALKPDWCDDALIDTISGIVPMTEIGHSRVTDLPE